MKETHIKNNEGCFEESNSISDSVDVNVEEEEINIRQVILKPS